MDSRLARLTVRVKAMNRVGQYANDLHPILVKIFEPLVGLKIEKADGTLLEKYKKLLPDFPCTPALSVYRHVCKFSLAFTVKVCEFDVPNTVVYEEKTVYVGDMSDGVLVKLSIATEFRTDYTVVEILQLRDAYKTAKELADRARSNLYPFGEEDR